MNVYSSDKIRNVCLVGHSNAGKTSLVETVLFNAGVTNRIGKVTDGNTVSDYDTEEIRRSISIRTSMITTEWKDCKINFLDTPGYFDFVGDMMAGIRASDTALIVVSGKSGARVGGEIAFNYSKERNRPIAFYINKIDYEDLKFDSLIDDLRNKFGNGVIPIQLPIKEGNKFVGLVDIIESVAYKFDGSKLVPMEVPQDLYAKVQEIKGHLCEMVAEADEELMEKFFSDEPFTKDDLKNGIRKAMVDEILFPVLCGSAELNLGISLFMDLVVEYFPSPVDEGESVAIAKGETIKLMPNATSPVAALVFKTIVDPFIGRLSLFRLYSGTIKANSSIFNSTTETAEKIGQLFVMRGKEKIEVQSLNAGDIGAVAKFTNTHTGDTLCLQSNPITIEPIVFPEPVYSMAVLPKARGDEDKIGTGLQKLADEDPTFKYENNAEIHQLIISGLGDQHLEVIINRLKSMGTEVTLKEPKVSYRETIIKKIEAEGKHKKQSGGHGQYGHVKIEFEPCDSDDLVFCERIFGGSVPKNFHPAVEKGLHEMMSSGIQAGYKVVGLKATLYDGSYHDVDSSEMAFKMAAHIAFKELIRAGAIILEPIGRVEINIPDDYTGDVMGDINKRRGRVIGMESSRIIAEVPMSEMFKYAIDLRSMTHGRGKYIFKFERYEQAPMETTQKIIKEYQEEKANA